MMRKLSAATLTLAGLLSLASLAAAQAPVTVLTGCADSCASSCPESTCQRVTTTKTVTERKYSDVCEEYCRPHCSIFGGCSSCADGNCGSVHVKKYLVIHFVKHDECVSKCVVAPACAPACAPVYAPAYIPAMPMQNPGVAMPMPNK